MPFTLDVVVSDRIGFASHQNAAPVLRELRVMASDEAEARNCRLILRSDPPFLAEKVWRLDRVASGDEIPILDRDVQLNGTMLSGLSEAMSAKLTLTLEDSGGQELAASHRPVELLAHNEWGGIGVMADLIPAFVMPNDPAVDRVLKAASDALRRAGKPDAINGYESKERSRVWQIVSAIWSAVSGMGLSYALPPASFEQTGQKIRTPSQILEGRLATCLDTTLLFAAALEQASLNPLVILTKGHAFVGVWLQPSEFGALINNEAAALRRRFDLDELLVFETTLVTQAHPPAFSQAIVAGYAQINEANDGDFEMAVDIRRARMQKIRPLGVAIAPGIAPSNELPLAGGLEEAPALSAFETEPEEDAVTPAGRVRQWQRKLLNLTTSNRLLHLPDGAKAVRLFCPDPARLEDLLADGKKIRIKPMPELDVGGRDEALYDRQTTSSLRDEIGREALDRGEVLAPIAKDKLEAQLVDLYRKARSDMEEGGANTLFLAVGFLKWQKAGKEGKTYRAPLILVPVKLERKSALSGVAMVAHEDESRFNLTLLELLRQDFELTIPRLEGDLPTDHSGLDVPLIWRLMRDAVKEIAGFEVVPEVALGTFSFAKYLMWKDLVDREALLRESPLVRHLIERDGMMSFDVESMPRVEDLDREIAPAELFAPLPADSSQLRAVIASARGQNFVLDGPPGTGKSQTIANMIAHNLTLGRRVLFVAEKRAALDVVHRRLTEHGLAPFCLELHSAKATKSAVLRQLGTAWETRDTLTVEQWGKAAEEAKGLRDRLNAIVAVLHRTSPCGLTIHRAIGRYLHDGGVATPSFAFAPDAVHDADAMDRMREIARRLGIARREVIDLPETLSAVAPGEWSNGWQERVVAAARALPLALDRAEAAAADLAAATSLPISSHAARRLLALVDACLATHGHDLRFAFAVNHGAIEMAARELLVLVPAYRNAEAELSARYAAEVAANIDLDGLGAAWRQAGEKFWFLATLAKGKVAKRLAESGGAGGKVDPGRDLPLLVDMRAILAGIALQAARAAAMSEWQGIGSDLDAIKAALGRADALRQAITTAASGTDQLIALRSAVAKLVIEANELLAPDGEIALAAARLREAVAHAEKAIETFDGLCHAAPSENAADLRARAAAVLTAEHRLRDWVNWQRIREQALALDLAPLVAGLEQAHFAPDEAMAALETGYARWFALQQLDAEPLLRDFMPGEHAELIERFRAVDTQLSELTSRYIRARICGGIPSKDEVTKNSSFGVLRHQLQLQRPSKPIRQLAGEMGEAFCRLAPCMLMSPLSIAQYLPADQALFDLVIFDEASQITPWDAIGAMARGKQVVIAGDPRQMPPSSNFERQNISTEEDDDTETDMESILDECLAAGVPQIELDWHYRSRHESLITFSNLRYYENRLVTFPAPDTRPSAVTWRRVDGVFARGKERTNGIEAQAMVDEAVRLLRDPAFVDERGRPLSLGIITMNVQQMALVERLLDVARQKDPALEKHFADDRLEPVCVRNLETAQGDERDVILLGVSFGPTEPGGRTMPMTFGKLNMSGGWRRLNVAVTRARRAMQVFTSFDPGMIDLTRTNADGVRDLKAFIEFAGRGKEALASADRGSLGSYDSPFEEAVAQELRRRGWKVVTQVGVSKFRIDLGIADPDRPGDYLLGVECDGATYHSAATARDRDKVRSAILEGLGWKLLRVWSTDWWYNRERAAEQLHRDIEKALAASRSARDAHEACVAAAVAAAANDDAIYPQAEAAPASFPTDAEVTEDRPALYARQGGAPASIMPLAGEIRAYRNTDFGSLAAAIDPDAFYEPSYRPFLAELVTCVVEQEGPIAESQLVNRIARAHGFRQSGSRIYERVMQAARQRHHVAPDGATELFVWRNAATAADGIRARFPADEAHIRQIQHIAKAELASAGSKDPVEIARLFGVRRLSALARERIEAALANG